MAYYEIEQLTERGVVGVWTHGFYDGWAPNYMFYVANGHNSIGRFYETFGNLYPETEERTLRAFGNIPHLVPAESAPSQGEMVAAQQHQLEESGLLLGLDYMAQHPQEFLSNFYLKSKRSVAKATAEGPAAWAILNDGKSTCARGAACQSSAKAGRRSARLDHDVEVKQPATLPKAAEGESKTEAKPEDKAKTEKPTSSQQSKRRSHRQEGRNQDRKIPKGSYIIRMDQPYSRIADMLLTRSTIRPPTRVPTMTRDGLWDRCATSRLCASPTKPS